MDREKIIAHLKEVKRIVYNRLYIQGLNKYIATYHELNNLLKSEKFFDDEELLDWAHRYEDIKPLSFDD